MNATNRRVIAACLLHTTAAGAGAAAAFTTAGHSTIAYITLAAAIAISGLAALAREWFWYSALRRPARNLDCSPPFFLSVKSAPGVVAGEGHLRRGGAGRATTP